MGHCPKCRSENLVRSRCKTRWERWRKQITGKRPYRCRTCGWRGWHRVGSSRLAAQSRVSDPPNLKGTMLAREDPRLQFDLKKLDEFDRVPGKGDAA